MVREPVTVMTPISSPAAPCVGLLCPGRIGAKTPLRRPYATMDARKNVREVII